MGKVSDNDKNQLQPTTATNPATGEVYATRRYQSDPSAPTTGTTRQRAKGSRASIEQIAADWDAAVPPKREGPKPPLADRIRGLWTRRNALYAVSSAAAVTGAVASVANVAELPGGISAVSLVAVGVAAVLWPGRLSGDGNKGGGDGS